MAGLSAGAEAQPKLQPTPPARPRMLRVEVNGLLHDWFDIDEMGQFVRSPTFSTTLRENIARYFGVPVKQQAIYDEDGLLTTSADFSRALQRFSPKLYIYDAHEMGEHLRERTSEQLAMIDAEVEQSRKNFRMTNSKPRSTTPRQRRGSRSDRHDGGHAEALHDGAPEVTPVKAMADTLAANQPADHGTQPVATLTTSASSIETMNIGPAPVQGIEAVLVKNPMEVAVEKVAWQVEPSSVQAHSGTHTPVTLVPEAMSAVPTSQEVPIAARLAVAAPQAASVRTPSQGPSVAAASAGAPRVLRPSMSVRAPSARPGGSTTIPVMVTERVVTAAPVTERVVTATPVTATPPQGSPVQYAAPPSGTRRASIRMEGRHVQGAAAELAHATQRPVGRSLSPQPVPAVVMARPVTPVRVPSQARLEHPAAWQSPGAPPPWQSPQGCPPQHIIHPHAAPVPIQGTAPYSQPVPVVQAAYPPVAVGPPGQVVQVPLAPQCPLQMPPQQFSQPAKVRGPVGSDTLVRDGSPTREFVESAGRFFGFVDQLQKRGARKPRSGSEEGTRNMMRMQNADNHGMFDGEVESIWD